MLKPVKLLDALFLHAETAATPMHVGALFLLERPRGRRAGLTQRLRKLVAARLGASEVFTRRLTALPMSLANPMWTTTADIDLEHHIRRSVLPAPGNWQQLENRVAHLHEALLDRKRPLWELHVIEGLEDGRSALYVKTHHAGLDGHSAQLFLAALVDPSPRPRPVRCAPPSGSGARPLTVIAASTRHQLEQMIRLPARTRELVTAAVELLRGRETGSGATPRTVINDVVTARRSFGTCEIPLQEARAIAGSTGSTLNDVVLAAVSGAIRRWLLDHGLLPREPLHAGVPVSMRPAGDADHSIQVAFISVNLHTTDSDAKRRLAAIGRSAATAKDKAGLSHSLIPQDVPSLGLPWMLAGLSWLVSHRDVAARVPLPFNLIVSNVPGPREPLYVAGQRMLTYLPISIVYHGVGLNVSVYSYDGVLFFGLTACPDLLPDVQLLARYVREEFVALAAPRSSKKKAARSTPARSHK